MGATRLLFLCSKNACLSQMAEALAERRADPDVEVVSAGIEAAPIDPIAVRVMQEIGIDISKRRTKALHELSNPDFDVIITLTELAAKNCPVLPGNPERVDWRLPDADVPPRGDEDMYARFITYRNLMTRLIDDFFDRGYLSALAGAKRNALLILNNISEGIVAHDLRRRIFYFNEAAAHITGYPRADVLYKDCHDVFPDGLCGGKCIADADGCVSPHFDFEQREMDITTRSGELRRVRMQIKAMVDTMGEHVGVLASFRDVTREFRLARRVGELHTFSGIIGRDSKMLEIFDLIRDLANTNVPVLIQGDSGTGKELVAAAIHNEGARASKLFVPVNCGALPESLLESELFGHVKGAFTGAIRDKKGRFELSDGGTIFLDEIGDITPAMQVKLLRVVQEGTFERVGSEKTLHVDVRVISATNKDLARAVNEGEFRDDLYYRLAVVPVTLPPLRERRLDIPLIVNHVLERIAVEAGREGIKVSDDAMDVLLSYDWPGNVRELQNWLQFAMIKCKSDAILPEHLPRPMGESQLGLRRGRRRKLDLDSVRAALRETKGNKVDAARLLGVSRATLYRFLNEAGLLA